MESRILVLLINKRSSNLLELLCSCYSCRLIGILMDPDCECYHYDDDVLRFMWDGFLLNAYINHYQYYSCGCSSLNCFVLFLVSAGRWLNGKISIYYN